jgi:hypothetical protein
MKKILSVVFAFAASTVFADAEKPVLLADINCAGETRAVSSKGKGSLEGVLPKGLNDNFSSWSKAFVKTSQIAEKNGKFIRFETVQGGEPGQFSCQKIDIETPGAYRCTVKANTRNEPLKIGIRQTRAPYGFLWSGTFSSSGMDEITQVFRVGKPDKEPPFSMFVWTPGGTVDIESIKFWRVPEKDFAAKIDRPAKGTKELASSTRFPLGLPFGWNVSRESFPGGAASRSNNADAEALDVLHVDGDENFALYSAPFQVCDPEKRHTVQFLYRSDADWQVFVKNDSRHWLASKKVKASPEWSVGSVSFKPGKYAEGFFVEFKGSGIMQLDRFSVRADDEGGLSTNSLYEVRAEVALEPKDGEIARGTRIQFEDEPSTVRWCVLNAPKDSVLELKVTDVYNRTKTIDTVKFKEAKKIATGTVDYLPKGIVKLGQFRVSGMLVDKGGSKAALVGETVVTRIKRPVAWGKDAPESPFGAHFLANENMVKTMKAAGVNWARFHDAGTAYTGWSFLETEKGKWKFSDAQIAMYRNNHIKIYAQLGTAPAWATHFGDLGLKQLGYFGRYLRPTNMVDYVNYVKTVVKRYEKSIDEYFVWNEPWGNWWASAKDIKFYDKEKAAYDFGVFQVATSKAAKEAVPGIKISGYNTYDSKDEWTAGVDTAPGAFESCDSVDYHFYTTANQFIRSREVGESAILSNACVAPLALKYPAMKDKPVYMSEGQGASSGSGVAAERMSGLYSAILPWKGEKPSFWLKNADMSSKYVVALLAQGVSKIFLYTAHGYVCLCTKPSFITLVGADGYPYPSLAAFSHTASMLEGKKIVKKENCGAKGVAYTFAGGGKTCTVYSMLSKEEAVALASDGQYKTTDLFGNPFSKDTYFEESLLWREK